MKFPSTRGGETASSFLDALRRSIAVDGGLFVPEAFPSLSSVGPGSLVEVGTQIASRFLEPPLDAAAICHAALNFPIPLVDLRDRTAVLELFHGPSSAFKDVGARFLAECLSSVRGTSNTTILVATSGDTGGAVAAAFWKKSGFDVVILFPEGKVSERQERQLTAWGENVRAFAVRGDFDDCQRVAKEAFADAGLRSALGLGSANSISVGRLLPQSMYYAWAALEYRARHGRDPGFIVPTGNLGNALAALWARKMGFPVREIVFATNANQVVPAYLSSGQVKAQPTRATLANAMDVGNPSNLERLRALYPNVSELSKIARAISVDDEAIRDVIRRGVKDWGQVWCPHTATAVYAREQLRGEDWVIVATAHPAKFETIVEPLVGSAVPVPPALAATLARKPRVDVIEASLAGLKAALGI